MLLWMRGKIFLANINITILLYWILTVEKYFEFWLNLNISNESVNKIKF